ncbi:MAG TPA: polysaccharide biosynthesis C-terminal domain-containing protein [Patescibacteria group bacterium]|nr:polysaccharide biosynthesis C-terminal domain-containing protein [Patescibacteria group bacterium]
MADSAATNIRERPDGYGLGHRLVANAATNFVGQAVLLALAFSATPYIVGRFGASRYGVLMLVLGFVNLLSLFQLGFNSGLVKYLSAALGSGNAKETERYLCTGLALYLGIGIGVAFALSLGAQWSVSHFFQVPGSLRREAVMGLYLAAVAFALRFVAEVFSAVPIAAQRFDIVNALFVGSEIVRIAGSVAVVYLGFLVRTVLAVSILSSLLFLAGSLFATWHLVPGARLRPSISGKHLRDLLHFSKFAAVSQAASRLGNGMDGVIIGHLMPVAFVAFYVVPATLCFKIWALVGNVTSVTFPAASSPAIGNSPARLRELYLRSSKMVFALAGLPALSLCFLGRPVLADWINPVFAREGATALELLSVAVFLNCLMHIPDCISNGLGRPWVPAGFNVAETILKFTLFFVLIPPFGVAGAAAGYLITQVLVAPGFLRTANRMVGVGWRELFRRAYAPALLPLGGAAIALGLCQPYTQSIGTLLLTLAFAGAIFLILSLFFILDSQERAALAALAGRAGLGIWATGSHSVSGGES